MVQDGFTSRSQQCKELCTGHNRRTKDLQKPFVCTEGSEFSQEERSVLSIPEEGVIVKRPVRFIVDLDSKVLV